MGVGDEIMVTGQARVMQLRDPRKVRVTHKGVMRWDAIWDHNPRIARLEERGDFQELQARGPDNHRPYHTGKTDQRWIYNLAFRAERGEIYLTVDEKTFGDRHRGRLLIEPHIKAKASPNKQWGWDRWQALADLLRKEGLEPTQLGPAGTRKLNGVQLIETGTFRQAAAVIATASAVVLPEGGPHHAAAAFGIPGVVIFGGFTPVELTGYEMHRNLGVSLGDACGMRIACDHCRREMAKVTPEQVLEELQASLA